MKREEHMIVEYEALMNIRFSAQDRALMVSAMKWADFHPVNKIVYVVTRSEEHNDYIEVVFYNRENAEKYCKQFNDNEDEYHRNITETIIKD